MPNADNFYQWYEYVLSKLFSIRGKEALSKLFEDWTLPVLLLQSVLRPGDIAVMLEDPEPPRLGFGAN